MVVGSGQAANPTDAVSPERRTALVIGNGDYQIISPLRNPVNDARAMARVLRELGFDVIAKENLTRYEMRKAIRDFGRELFRPALNRTLAGDSQTEESLNQ